MDTWTRTPRNCKAFKLYAVWSHVDVDSKFRALLTILDADSMIRARLISDLKFAIEEKNQEIPSVFGVSLNSLKVEEENKDGWINIIYDAYCRGLPIRWISPQYCKCLNEILRKLSLFNCFNQFQCIVHL